MRLGVPGLPDLVETLAEGRYDARPRHRPGPGRRRRDPAQPDRRHAAARAATTPSWPPTRACAAATAAIEAIAQAALGRLLRRALAGPLAEPGSGSLAARARCRAGAAGPLGARRRRLPLRARQGRLATPTPARSRSSTPAASPARRGSTCSPRASCGRAPPTPGSTCCSPAAAPRRPSCGRGWANDATFLGWLEGEELARAYASADVFLFCSTHRHLRAGDARGRRQRAAGGRGRRGRPCLAGREPPHRHALPARSRPPRRQQSCSSPPRRCCVATSAPRPSAPPASAPGSARWSSSPTATDASSGLPCAPGSHHARPWRNPEAARSPCTPPERRER